MVIKCDCVFCYNITIFLGEQYKRCLRSYTHLSATLADFEVLYA